MTIINVSHIEGIPVKKALIPVGNQNRPGRKINPTFITVHETDNTSKTAGDESHGKYVTGSKAPTSWHATVDEDSITIHLPLNEEGWHAGTTAGNRNSVGVEICVNGNYEKALRNAAALVRYLMKLLGIPIARVVPHKHWSGKNCPRRLLARGFHTFTNMLSVASQNGWVQNGNSWSYYENGNKKYGWLQDGDNWFYFDGNGCMVTGWYQVREDWFYFNPISDGSRGRMLTGWQQIGEDWFYLNPISDGTRGKMLTGWQHDGNWYYLNPAADGTQGKMLVDWQEINEKWYYFNPISDGTRGMMVTGMKAIDGKEYTFRNDGSLVE